MNKGLEHVDGSRSQVAAGLDVGAVALLLVGEQVFVDTVLEDGEGCIRIAHAVDSLCQAQIDRGGTIDGDVGTRELGHNGEGGVVAGHMAHGVVAAQVAKLCYADDGGTASRLGGRVDRKSVV